MRDGQRRTYAREIGGYFEQGSRVINFSSDSSIDIKIIQYHRLLSDWLNMIGRSGFVIEKVIEPKARR
ncbi:MAG TPA: hypothetical protein VKK79_04250 [Candidatus Lokiarchaeia archaeon]|nr:hypothetical protein [Candidatus Lokiarchaeia archaeon]